MHHTHVDIGYTEPQDIVLRKHPEFIARALDYCTATDHLPDGERFCWTCEAGWTVKAFLRAYPERTDEFFARVRQGRIEISALYLNLTDLFTEELLIETTDEVLALAQQHGVSVVTAVNDDVTGWSWGLADILAQRGVRYMDTGINETRATSMHPRPQLLHWIGPQGGKVLLWHSSGYMLGNSLGLSEPQADERVAKYLHELENNGYPYHVVQAHIQGRKHDNAPPGLWLCDMVRKWNATHTVPKLRLVTPRIWFEHAEAHWPTPFAAYCAGWPDWWSDGLGSAARESALARQAQAELKSLRALSHATGLTPPAERVEQAREATIFFCEHTWGAWCSTDMPDTLTSQAQWNAKAGYAYSAAVQTRSLLTDQMAAAARSHADGPCIAVFNPSDETRGDVVELTVADADIGLPTVAWVTTPVRSNPGPDFHLVDEQTRTAVPLARTPTIADSARRPAQIIRFMAHDVPARGWRRYRIVPDAPPRTSTLCTASGDSLRSPFVAVRAADNLGITTVHDQGTGLEWMRRNERTGWTLGQVVYEAIPGQFSREKLCGWGWGSDGMHTDAPWQRTRLYWTPPQPVLLPYGAGWRLAAQNLAGSLRALELDVVVYDNLPRIDLTYRLDKVPNAEAEALYVAFPLGGATSGVCLDIPGGVLRPGIDQVPGSATDWHGVQHYFAVSTDERTTVVASPDIPMVQVNDINTGKWQEALPAHNGLVMSWVMNNYWFTNFPAAQGGGLTWRYSLTAWPGSFDPERAARFAGNIRQPLLVTLVI